MSELTSRERLLRLFRGETIDTIPVSTRIAPNFTREYFDDCNVDIVEGAYEIYRSFGMDIIDWNCTPHFEFADFTTEGPGWKPTVTVESSGGTSREIVDVETPGGRLRRVISTTRLGKYEEERALTEYPIKAERDFELICEYMPPVAPIDCGILKRARAALGDDGILSPSFHGPFNILVYAYRKVDDLLLDIYTNPKFFHAMMDFFLDRLMKFVQQMIDTGAPDLFDVGANVANGRLVSPELYADVFIPYENRLADLVQSQGVHAMLHNCGYAANHLDVYRQLHHRAWGYLTPPPYGDVVIADAVKKLPENMILWGNIDQIDFLRTSSQLEIERTVREVIETVKLRGGFVLGTSDYLETNTPYDNIQALVDAGRKYGAYVADLKGALR